MKRDLVMGWVFIALALLMVLCIVINCIGANWVGLPICGSAFGMDLMSAVNHFKRYKMRKEYEKQYSIMSMRCWSDYDEPEDTAGMLSSGSFIDD